MNLDHGAPIEDVKFFPSGTCNAYPFEFIEHPDAQPAVVMQLVFKTMHGYCTAWLEIAESDVWLEGECQPQAVATFWLGQVQTGM